jgi:hypothetical protein
MIGNVRNYDSDSGECTELSDEIFTEHFHFSGVSSSSREEIFFFRLEPGRGCKEY